MIDEVRPKQHWIVPDYLLRHDLEVFFVPLLEVEVVIEDIFHEET